MSSLISVLRDPVPYQGAFGLFATLTIDRLNGFVGLLVARRPRDAGLQPARVRVTGASLS